MTPEPSRASDRPAGAVSDPLAEQIRAVAQPLAETAGLDLVDVVVRGSGRRLVRVVVDRKGGVDLQACRELSRAISSALDEGDLVPDRYDLEVTSPGVNHPLEGRRAFERVEGRDVSIQRRNEQGGVREVRGRVLGADDEVVLLEISGEQEAIPHSEIAKATQALPW